MQVLTCIRMHTDAAHDCLQDVSKEGGYGKKEVESKSTLVAKTVGGNQVRGTYDL